MYILISTAIILLQEVIAYITKDEGETCQWNYYNWGQYGTSGKQYTQKINFNGLFQNIPEVVVKPYFFENVISSSSAFGYQLTISLITLTSFNINSSLDYNLMYNLCFYWFAFDDERFEVIHQFNIANPASTTLPHNNKNALAGFIFFTSFVASNTVDFTLAVNSITETTFHVSITQTNLLKLGYSVFLGPQEALNITDLMTVLPLSSNPFCSGENLIVQNQFWNFYFTQPKIANSSTSTYETYCLTTWDSSSFLKCGHQCTTINFEYLFYPMRLSKIRISKMESRNIINTIKFSVEELGIAYDSIVDENFEANSSITSFTFSANVVCQKNQKVVGQFFKYYTNPNMERITKNCLPSQNQISFYPIFVQQRPQTQYFSVSITDNQLLLKQIIYNQVMETTIILQVDIQQQ